MSLIRNKHRHSYSTGFSLKAIGQWSQVWPACFPDVSCCLRTDGERASPARSSSRHRLLTAFLQNMQQNVPFMSAQLPTRAPDINQKCSRNIFSVFKCQHVAFRFFHSKYCRGLFGLCSLCAIALLRHLC